MDAFAGVEGGDMTRYGEWNADPGGICRDCVYAEWDEYGDGWGAVGYVSGCKKDLEPFWREDEECVECEGHRRESDGTVD